MSIIGYWLIPAISARSFSPSSSLLLVSSLRWADKPSIPIKETGWHFPVAWLRCRPSDQHPVDNSWLYSWNHSRSVRIPPRRMIPLVSASSLLWELAISTSEANARSWSLERSLTVLQIHHPEVLRRQCPPAIFTPKSYRLTKPDSHNLRSFFNNPVHNPAFSASSVETTCSYHGMFGFWRVARHFRLRSTTAHTSASEVAWMAWSVDSRDSIGYVQMGLEFTHGFFYRIIFCQHVYGLRFALGVRGQVHN